MPMTREEFAFSLKDKYPQYRELDNEDLVERVLQQYPQYKAEVVGEGATVAAPAAPAPEKPEMGMGEYLGGLASGFGKQAGEMAASVMDTGALAGTLGIGPKGSPTSRDAIARYLAEKLSGSPGPEDPKGTMQPFDLEGAPEQIGGVGARLAVGAGVGGALSAAAPAAGILSQAALQGVGAGAEALAAGDDPILATALGVGGGIVGGTARGVKQFRAGAPERELRRMTSALGVTKKHLGKNPDSRYRPAETAIENKIKRGTVPEMRGQVEGRLKELGAEKASEIANTPGVVASQSRILQVAQNLDDMKRTLKELDDLPGQDQVKAVQRRIRRWAQTGDLDAEGVNNLLGKLDTYIKHSKGPSNEARRKALFQARKEVRKLLVDANPRVGDINMSRRDLGAAAQALRDKELAEAAKNTVPVGPGQQAAIRLSTSEVLRRGGSGLGAYALARWIEEKLRGATQ